MYRGRGVQTLLRAYWIVLLLILISGRIIPKRGTGCYSGHNKYGKRTMIYTVNPYWCKSCGVVHHLMKDIEKPF